jgi:hypothetical protein
MLRLLQALLLASLAAASLASEVAVLALFP